MTGYGEKSLLIQNRLKRIEGQVRGLQRMVADESYCIDVLTQVSATTRALQAVALQLLQEHLEHCIRDAIEREGADVEGKIAEAYAAIERLVRS